MYDVHVDPLVHLQTSWTWKPQEVQGAIAILMLFIFVFVANVNT